MNSPHERQVIQGEALATLVAKTSGLLGKFEHCCAGIEQELSTSIHRLDDTVQAFPEALRQSAESVLHQATQPAVKQLNAELHASVRAHQHGLVDAHRQVIDAAHALNRHLQEMRMLHRHLIWKIVGVAVFSLALLLIGGMWLSMHYVGVIRANQISAELMKAYRHSDVVRCEARLCARVDLQGKRYGKQSEYVPIRLR